MRSEIDVRALHPHATSSLPKSVAVLSIKERG
jgi:hypothetical protein